MKGRIMPVSVPWMVSPSVSAVSIVFVENGDLEVEVNVAAAHPNRAGEEEVRDPRVVLTFEAGHWLRTYPAAGEEDAIPHGWFDQSLLPFRDSPGADSEELTQSFHAEWQRTEICPDGGLYEVLDSEWLKNAGADRFDCKHFVLAARDMWLETLCRGFSWDFVRNGEDGLL